MFLPLFPVSVFQSTPPVKAATRVPISGWIAVQTISIHAAREGGDAKAVSAARKQEISIHAAREGGDLPFGVSSQRLPIFQSTPPVKAATHMSMPVFGQIKFQSTPPVKAATRSP